MRNVTRKNLGRLWALLAVWAACESAERSRARADRPLVSNFAEPLPRTSDFSDFSGSRLGGHLALRRSFTATRLVLKARPAIDGDINLDGVVNIFDINVVSNRSTGGAAAVPEPSGLALAGVTAGMLVCRQRRRCTNSSIHRR